MDANSINATSPGSVIHDFPLWHQYMLVGVSIAFQNVLRYPLSDFVQTLNIQFLFISKTKNIYIAEREIITKSSLESPAWVATGPCGAARYSSEEQTNFMQVQIAVNELFYVNVTVLQQIMTYVHPESNTSCVAMASGNWKNKYKKCGTGGKYYRLMEHNVVYIDVSYNEMNDTVFVAFVYQVTDTGAMNNKYFLPDFISLTMDPNQVFSASEALRHKGRELLLWTFGSLDVLHTVFVYSRYSCSWIVGHNKVSLQVWDGAEVAFITASGFYSDLTILHSAELCGDGNKIAGETKEFVASETIGSLTIGLDYQITATSFLLQMQIITTPFMCTPPICTYTETPLPVPHTLSQHERFSIVLETTPQVHKHLFFSNSNEQFPVLKIDDVTYETTVLFNTSTCNLGSVHINVPGYFRIITFCSKIQLQFLSKSAMFGGIHFSKFGYFIIKNHGRFGRFSVNYTLSLSHCEGIINICDKVPAPETWYIYQNAEINAVRIRRKENACIVIYNFPSDTSYKSTKCFFLATSTELYYRNNLILQLSETMDTEEKHPLCNSSVIVSVNAWKMRQKEMVVLNSPTKYIKVDFWYYFTLFSNCPSMGSYIQIYLQDAPSACDVESVIPKVLSWNELVLFCGITLITGVKTKSETWILELTRSSHKTDFRDRCCRMSVNIISMAPVMCSLSDMIKMVVFRELFFRNNSFVAAYPIWYYIYPQNHSSFEFTLGSADHSDTPKIIIFPLLTGNSSCLPHGSNFGFNMTHQQFHFDTYMNPFLLAPILSFG